MRDKYINTLIFVIATIGCMFLCPLCLRAQEDAHEGISTDNREVKSEFDAEELLDLPSFLVPRLYRKPDIVPYKIDRFYKGLSLNLAWATQYWLHPDHVRTNELKGWSVALGKDFDKHGTMRLGYERQKSASIFNLGYEWNLSNSYFGYDPNRSVRYLLTMGALVGQSNRKWWGGGYLGAQMRKTLAPTIDFVLEPQIRLSSNFADGHANNVPVDASYALHAGFNVRLSPPYMNFPKSDYLSVNRYHGLQRLYVEIAGGAQFTKPVKIGYNHSWGNYEMNVGYQYNQIWGVQAGLFSEQVNLVNDSLKEPYFGLRAELTADILQLFWTKGRSNGWAWNISVGGEAGRLETGSHLENAYFHNYGLTYATQIRHHLAGNLWVFLQGRRQTISVARDQAVYTAQVGLHYDMSSRITDKTYNPSSFYIMGGYANLDACYHSWQAGVGYDFNPIHGVRIDYSSSTENIYPEYVMQKSWNTLALDYMCNVSNAILGYNHKRRMNLILLTGYNVSIHDKEDKDWSMERTMYMGIEAGCQFEFQLAKHLSLYTEEKTVFQPFDTDVSPSSQQAWHIMFAGGLKIKL